MGESEIFYKGFYLKTLDHLISRTLLIRWSIFSTDVAQVCTDFPNKLWMHFFLQYLILYV